MHKMFSAKMKMFRLIFLNMKLRNKLAIIYSIIIIIPVIIVGLISYRISENTLTNEVTMLLESDLDKSAGRIDAYLKTWFDKCEYISVSDTVMWKLWDDYSQDHVKTIDFYSELNSMINSIERNENIKADSRQSIIEFYVFNNTLIKDEYYIKDSSDFKAAALTKKTISAYPSVFWLPVSKMANGADVITLCKKLYSYNFKDTIGIICIHIPVSVFKDELSRIKLPSDGWLAYLDDNNNIIFSFNTNNIQKPLITDALHQNKRRIEVNHNIVLIYNTAVNGGKLILSYPESYYKQKVNGIFKATEVVVILSIFGAILVSFLIARLITGRLTHFVARIRHTIKEGTPRGTLMEGNDEIGQINNEFNQMIDRVNILLEEKYTDNIKRRIMELELLQYQANPHFLYNILSSIKWISYSNNSSVIREMVDSIVRFYRILFNNGNEIISIASELEIIKEYINIQLFTYDYRFDVEYDIEPAVLEWYTIKLILQPVVENAILHGIIGKNDDSGKLKISGKMVGDEILFEVEDNGAGMDENTLLKLSSVNSKRRFNKGYGIRSVQDRIRLVFGESYGLFIESKENFGTRVTVKIPACGREMMEKILERFI